MATYIDIKGRYMFKHDTETNWLKATNFIPLKAEPIIYDKDSTHTEIRFKIGDGATNVNDLPFLNEAEFEALDLRLDEVEAELEKKANTASLHKIATSGKYSDLIEAPADYIKIDLSSTATSGTLSATHRTAMVANPHKVVFNRHPIWYYAENLTSTTYFYTSQNVIYNGNQIQKHVLQINPTSGAWSYNLYTYTPTDNDTTYSAGAGLSLSGTTFSNAGVRGITSGSENGTISVNTNGKTTDVSVKGLDSAAYKPVSAFDAAGTAETKAEEAYGQAKTYTDTAISNLINSAPSTLDTLGEIATAMAENEDIVAALDEAVGTKSAKTHKHTVSYTPAGAVSQPTFTGTAASHDHKFVGTGVKIKGTFTGTEHIASVDYTPTGTVSTPTITVTPNTTSVYSITGVGSLPSLDYTAVEASKITSWSAGTAPSLTLHKGSLPSASLDTGSVSLTGSVSSTTPNRRATLTFSYSAPTLSFSPGSLPSATFNAGSLPSLAYTQVSADEITNWSAGAVPSRSSAITVATGIKSATSTQPSFSGTGTTLNFKHTPTGTIAITAGAPGTGETANYTPEGNIGATSITPAGTVSKPTFGGTAATLTTNAADS